MCSDCHTFESSGQRGPANLGPARRVAEHPFVIITGTECDVKLMLFHSVSVFSFYNYDT